MMLAESRSPSHGANQTFLCVQCSSEFDCRRVIKGEQVCSRFRCPECRKAVLRRAARDRYRAAQGAVPHGTPVACRFCAVVFPRRTARHCVCDDCKAKNLQYRTPTYLGRQSERTKKRMQEDPAFALNQRMRGAVKNHLSGRKCGRPWQSLVGYTLDDLVRHLERQFPRGMTWQNRRLWHVDHILPLSSFKFTTTDDPEFKAAWALTNLRPLWKRENLQKNARRTHLI